MYTRSLKVGLCTCNIYDLVLTNKAKNNYIVYRHSFLTRIEQTKGGIYIIYIIYIYKSILTAEDNGCKIPIHLTT